MTESDLVLMGKYLLEMALLGFGWIAVFCLWILAFAVGVAAIVLAIILLLGVYKTWRDKR